MLTPAQELIITTHDRLAVEVDQRCPCERHERAPLNCTGVCTSLRPYGTLAGPVDRATAARLAVPLESVCAALIAAGRREHRWYEVVAS